MTLDRIPSGARVFVDSTIFVYHFTRASLDCRRCLERCERGDIKGVTSALVLSEVAHRLMMIEARSRGLVSPGNLVRKLRERPDVVRQLHVYQDQVEQIALMGIEVAPLEHRDLLHSAPFRARHGLLTNDSLVAHAAEVVGARAIASADADLGRPGHLPVFRPGDLAPGA